MKQECAVLNRLAVLLSSADGLSKTPPLSLPALLYLERFRFRQQFLYGCFIDVCQMCIGHKVFTNLLSRSLFH